MLWSKKRKKPCAMCYITYDEWSYWLHFNRSAWTGPKLNSSEFYMQHQGTKSKWCVLRRAVLAGQSSILSALGTMASPAQTSLSLIICSRSNIARFHNPEGRGWGDTTNNHWQWNSHLLQKSQSRALTLHALLLWHKFTLPHNIMMAHTLSTVSSFSFASFTF